MFLNDFPDAPFWSSDLLRVGRIKKRSDDAPATRGSKCNHESIMPELRSAWSGLRYWNPNRVGFWVLLKLNIAIVAMLCYALFRSEELWQSRNRLGPFVPLPEF